MAARLSFIRSAELERHVRTVIGAAQGTIAKNEKDFYKNSVDPFSALFDALWQGIGIPEWLNQEQSRQNQKTLQNALGDFHQNILGSMRGWENLGRGSVIDIENNKKKIIAEVKNKHNTTKGNHKVAIYDDLASQLRTRPGYTAYYVEVIPKNKKTYDKPFTPSDNRKHSRKAKNEAIRVIDGKSFYALASGDKDALKKVYEALPEVIAKVLKKSSRKLTKKDLDALFGRVY